MPAETIHLLTKNPNGWKRAATEMSMRTLPPFTTPKQNAETTARHQNERWKEIVREPSESSFTIVVPVSNVSKYLPSVLATFLLADIPPAVDINFVLVTNNCTDQGASVKAVEDFMKSVGDPVKKPLSSLDQSFSDELLSPEYSQVQADHSNTTFFHLDTMTPGKANASDIASTVALSQDHSIVMCLDANKFPEPETIPRMIGGAYRELIDTIKPAVIVTGKFFDEDIGVEENRLLLPTNIPPATLYVKGGIMAWNPQMQNKNSQKESITMLDDSALELFAIHRGQRIFVVERCCTMEI